MKSIFESVPSILYGVLICNMYNSIQGQATTYDRSRVGHMEREYLKPAIPMLLLTE